MSSCARSSVTVSGWATSCVSPFNVIRNLQLILVGFVSRCRDGFRPIRPRVSWYRRNRARSRALFDLLVEEAYYSQPIALRHPIVFYEGHLPGFSFNTLVKKGLGRPSIDPRLETLFARGIDPHEATAAGAGRGAIGRTGRNDGGRTGRGRKPGGSGRRWAGRRATRCTRLPTRPIGR